MRGLILLVTCLAWLSSTAVTVTCNVDRHELCSYSNGYIYATASGGAPPYSYSWTGPGGFTATTASIPGLVQGSYMVVVTDATNDTDSCTSTIAQVGYDVQFNQGPGPGHCSSPFFLFPLDQLGFDLGISNMDPFTVNGDPFALYDAGGGGYFFSPNVADGTSFSQTMVDVNGCSGTISGITGHYIQLPTKQILSISGSCGGQNNGSVTVAYGQEGNSQSMDLFSSSSINPIGWIGYQPDTITVNSLAPGVHKLWPVASPWIVNDWICAPHDTLIFTVPDLGIACGNVSGTVHIDYAQDCLFNGSDTRVPNEILQITPGPIYTTTDHLGNYSVDLPLGSYQLSHSHPVLDQFCPVATANFDLTAAAPVVDLDISDTSTVPLDVAISMANGPARPGFGVQYSIRLQNLTPSASGANQLVMDFDPVLSYVSAVPAPTSVAGNTLTWSNAGDLFAFGSQDIQVYLQVPANVALIGTSILASATVTPTNTDALPGNNSISYSDIITGAYDPNDKQLLTSSQYSTNEYYIGADQWLDYTIRFQNTGTDTAFTVVVTDSIAPELDVLSIQWGAASHAYVREVEGSGVVRFTFSNIQLPDSNVNELESHGFIKFRIAPTQPLLPGTVISNSADIFFDFNPPIRTNDAVITATASTAVDDLSSGQHFTVYPNPAGDQVQVAGDLPFDIIKLMSIDGKVLQQLDAISLVDIRDLATGLYLVRFEWRGTHQGTVRLVRQ